MTCPLIRALFPRRKRGRTRRPPQHEKENKLWLSSETSRGRKTATREPWVVPRPHEQREVEIPRIAGPQHCAYRPLLRMWLSGLILALTLRKTKPKERTLMLCDEIGNLGRIDALLTAATLLRSWGLTLW